MLTYVSVRSASRRGLFLVLHRNIAVIRVCLSAVRRTGVNEFVTPVTQTVAYIGYAPVCGGGAFAYSMRIFPRHDAVSAAGAMRGGRARPLFWGLRGRYASFGNTRSRKMGIFCAIRPNSRILSGARQSRVRARDENTTTARFFAGCRRQAYRAVSGGALIGRTARFRAARCRQQGCEIRGETILFCAKNARFYALFGGLCIKI